MSTSPQHFAVFGRPIAHSRSPHIHTYFAQKLQINLHYRAILVEGSFAQALADFRQSGGRGGNVTVPFKEEAFALSQVRHPRAMAAGAVNTLWWDSDGVLHGDNTDGVGLIRDLTNNLHQTLRGASVLILGAGGAVRGVLSPLIAMAPLRLIIANRTLSKAQVLIKLAEDFAREQPLTLKALAWSLEELAEPKPATPPFDLIINASSGGLTDSSTPVIGQALFHHHTLAYDMIYGKPTPFLRWAQSVGARTSDGLGMLVEQAASAFEVWHGTRPETADLLAELRREVVCSGSDKN